MIYLIYLIFIISFFKGIFSLLGVNETVIHLSIDFLILVLISISFIFILRRKTIKGPLIYTFIFLLMTVLFSFLLNEVTLLQTVLFLQKFILFILFFYALFNIGLDDSSCKKIIKLIIYLLVLQIIAAFIKLFVLGGTLEKIVGTASVGEGSLATVLPLFAIAFLIADYLYFKKVKDIILILLFIGIGLISNKMGILFYVGALFILLSYIYSNSYKSFWLINEKFILSSIKVSFILIIIFIAFVKINPRANPEHMVGGSVDIEYLTNFVEKYNTLEAYGTGLEGRGRYDAFFVATERVYNQGLMTLLFGFGPGDIIKSSYVGYDDPLAEKYYIGYGGRTGYVWFIMQIGVIGLILFISLHVFLLKRLLKIYEKKRKSKDNPHFVLGMIGAIFVFFMDFFTYSTTLLESPAITLTYYFLLFYFIQKNMNQNHKERK